MLLELTTLKVERNLYNEYICMLINVLDKWKACKEIIAMKVIDLMIRRYCYTNKCFICSYVCIGVVSKDAPGAGAVYTVTP